MKVILLFLGGIASLLIGTLALNQLHPEHDSLAVSGEVSTDDAWVLKTSSTQEVGRITSTPVVSETKTNQTLTDFTLDFATKDHFDRFIFHRVDENPDRVKQTYYQYASTHYSLSTYRYASDLFGRYVDYKIALENEEVEVDLTLETLQGVAVKLERRASLRRDYFSEQEYYYLFSKEAQIDRAALERLRIAKESSMDTATRKALIMEALEGASDSEREAFKPTIDMHKIQQIKQSHSDMTSRYNAVAAEFGHEVAERFTSVWQAQSEWNDRVDAYREFKTQLSKDSEPLQYQRALTEYEDAHFDPNERKRLRVLTSTSDL